VSLPRNDTSSLLNPMHYLKLEIRGMSIALW